MTTAASNDALLGMLTLYKGQKNAEVQQNAEIVTMLERVGIPVPDRLAVAVKRGTWGVRVPEVNYQAVVDAHRGSTDGRGLRFVRDVVLQVRPPRPGGNAEKP